ncbi:MAG: pyridoxal-phosphate dependent enzyme [Flavobacteriales bacterium]
MWYNNILETIGNTPMVKLNKVVTGVPGTILAKVETFNPGNSVKDRMALQMVLDAEADGRLKPGGTIIECTSGNTGMGLAIAAVVKGYKLICTMPDKQSKEKMDMLRAMGAEVVVTPTNVAPDDPRSYYSVAKKLSQEIPNSFYPNQYDNPSNSKAHYLTTGPEIWEQTEGKITHLLVCVGTGGTISGTAKYLKEKNPNIKVWGIDTYGSVFKKYHETGIFDPNEIYSYLTEGFGEDILPANVDFKLIDLFEKVTDKDGMLMCRRIAREEGIFLGNSAGSAVQGLVQLKDKLKPEDVVVIVMHDSGTRYIGKIFNDDWMRERGFLETQKVTAGDLIKSHNDNALITVNAKDKVTDAIKKITHLNISQIPVVDDNGKFVGSISDSDIFNEIVKDSKVKSKAVSTIMKDPFQVIEYNTELDQVLKTINKSSGAILVKLQNGEYRTVTKHDIIEAVAK